MGNLKNVPQSQNVITQCKYENRRDSRNDSSVIVSLIQFTSIDPLTVALWCEKDIERFHQMIKKHSLLVATKLNGKEIFYFAFILPLFRLIGL